MICIHIVTDMPPHTSQQIFGALQYRTDDDMTRITFGTDVLALEQIDMPAVQTL